MRKLLCIVGILLFLVALVRIAIYRFTHIDMTEMRLFVNMWEWYIPLLGGAFLSYLSFKK